jgi:hypothetical protein
MHMRTEQSDTEQSFFSNLSQNPELRSIVEKVKQQLSQEMASRLTQAEFARIQAEKKLQFAHEQIEMLNMQNT